MTLNRGILAKIDRRVFSEYDHADGVQLAKIPLSDAEWSTWRRYCDIVGVSMGQGVAGLITYELGTVISRDGGDGSVFGPEMERRLATRKGGPRHSRTKPQRPRTSAQSIPAAAED